MALKIKLVESSPRHASELMPLIEDKKKEAHYHKKKVSFLKKSLETLEAQAHEQETEIDSLRFVLTRAPEEAVE